MQYDTMHQVHENGSRYIIENSESTETVHGMCAQ
jgi:hypothetical protein